MAVIERSFLLELPEDIIYHILSYFTNRERIRSTLASKPWLSLVQKCPNLELSDHRLIKRDDRADQDECNVNHVKRYGEELNYIFSTLKRYDRENIQLETFTLQPRYVKALHDRCINFAVKKGVRNLNLWMHNCTRFYNLPKSIFESKSLMKLELKACHIEPKERRIAWPNLKRLKIVGCDFEHEAFDNIISGCPNVENLTVDGLKFDVEVWNLRNLRQLNFKFAGKQYLKVINTPNLESLSCHTYGVVDFGDTEYPNLKSLDFHHEGIDECFFTNFASKFPKLENLHFECRYSLKRINLSSASLKKLKLSGHNLQEACFDVPNLVYFEYWGKIIHKLSFAGNSGRWFSSIELLENRIEINAVWFQELIGFLAALNKSETSITVKLNKDVVVSLNPPEVRTMAKSAAPIQGITRMFSINTNWMKKSTKSSSVRALLDFILLICHPRTVKFLDCKNSRYKLPRQFYDILKSTSSWDRCGVTDFEMVHRSSNYREEARLSGGFKNWDSKEWCALLNPKNFIFNLEYGCENVHMKKKRKLF